MARVLRGDIFWAKLDPILGHEQAGTRPVLVLSHEVFNDRTGTVIAVAITSRPQAAGFPLSMEISDTTLPKKSWIKIGQIRTLSVLRLGSRITRLSAEEINQVVEGLLEIIGDEP